MINKIKENKALMEEYQKVSEFLKNPHKRLKARNWVVSFALSTIRILLIMGLVFVILFPLFQQFSLAVRHPGDLNNPTVVWIPERWTTLNLEIAAIMLDYGKALGESLLLSTIAMILQVFVTSIAGYAFARLKFKGSGFLFVLVLITIIVPPQTVSLSRYLYFIDFDILGIFKLFTGKSLNLLHPKLSRYALYLMTGLGMGINSGIFIFIFRQFFRGIPTELDESAEVDGASVIRTFWSVILPNARSAMLTVGLFAFVWQYNDVYYADLLMLSTDERPLLPMRLSASMFRIVDALLYKDAYDIVGEKVTNNPFYLNLVANTAALLMMLPLLGLFIVLQRFFVEGIERTGLVG